MVMIYSTIVLLALCGVIVGLWGQGHLKSPYNVLASLLLPLSLIIGLGAVLLLCVPGFFE